MTVGLKQQSSNSPNDNPKERTKKGGKKKGKKENSKSGEKRKEYSDANYKSKRRKNNCDASVCKKTHLPDLRYILAPMVGASELAFRLLCRKYGATLAYTPMMDASRFARDAEYRKSEFQTCAEDRPLVCHFSANSAADFAAAAKAAEPYCDAVDLNLGCPQRTAFVGHFGSYLLGEEDRSLVLSMVEAANHSVSIPICVKIRLLDKLEETAEFVRQLRDAGAAWVAIHARYRATWERKGPGARDGPALLDHIQKIKKMVPDIPIIANGNIVTFEDAIENLALTKAAGVMSAEGILDNPSLFLQRYGENLDETVKLGDCMLPNEKEKKKQKLEKKLKRLMKSKDQRCLEDEECAKKLSKIKGKLAKLEADGLLDKDCTSVTLHELHRTGNDKIQLAKEYLTLAKKYPIKIRTIVFHTRRMLRDELNQYQLMEECVAATSIDEVQSIVGKLEHYLKNPESFTFDRDKAAKEKEALARKKFEEGKRKRFEARMLRKAKREGKNDPEFYLRIGAEVPSLETISRLKELSKERQLEAWKKNHSQHCMAYHLSKCQRDRGCAFLHVDARGNNCFVESEEVAG
mmetsp:Transcript_22120/g.33432  ORF Transcript_22120/g.33432 Transcript_22120/m.33432 type:complete len:577 (+) Transcript_22120:94-1824(+)